MEKITFNKNPLLESNRLIENNITSTRSNRLIEDTVKQNADIIENGWLNRHYKVCYKIGIDGYLELVHRSRKYGNNPTALLAYLVDKELLRG